jgi:GTPase Era involved in 16S rRNA processing
MMYKKEGFISHGWKVLSMIDFSLLVVDSAKRFDDMLRESIKRLERHRDYQNFMKSLVLNKIDLVDNRRKFDSLIKEIEKYGKMDKIFYVSARTGYGVKELQ